MERQNACGSILAACALGAAAYTADTAMQMKAVVAPLAIAVVGHDQHQRVLARVEQRGAEHQGHGLGPTRRRLARNGPLIRSQETASPARRRRADHGREIRQ